MKPAVPSDFLWLSSAPQGDICRVPSGRAYRLSSTSLISGFRRDVDEICAPLGCYAASCGNIPEERRFLQRHF